MMCSTVNSVAVRMKHGDLPISAFIISPLIMEQFLRLKNRRKRPHSVLMGLTSLSLSGLGSGAGEGAGLSKETPPPHSHELS